MKKFMLIGLLFLTACGSSLSSPNPNEPTPPTSQDYRLGSCVVAIGFEAFTGNVTGQARYTYDALSPLKDLHYVECEVDMVRVGDTIIDATWRFYIRSDTLTQGLEGTFERVAGKSDDLAYLNSFDLVDYNTTRRTSYNFRTEGYTAKITVQQNASGFRGSFSQTGNFISSTLANPAATITATFNGR